MELYRSPNGDTVVHKDKSIIVYCGGKRRILSTSAFQGGYRENCVAVFNHDGTDNEAKRYCMLADTYEEHMDIVARRLELDPMCVTGMDTAAQMDNVAIAEKTYRELTVTAIVTGGIEENGGRVGDGADYYEPDSRQYHHGTINIILLIDAELNAATLARALVTATEAKTAALQERLVGSRYSEGIATGSGTDQTILIANRESDIAFHDAGKHSKLGELIGRAVIEGVKSALEKQTGLNKQKQFSVIRRIGRFGSTYEDICHRRGIALTDSQQKRLAEIDCDQRWVIDASLIAHLCDQYRWGLLDKDEARLAIERILCGLARDYQLSQKTITDVSAEELLYAIIEMAMKEN